MSEGNASQHGSASVLVLVVTAEVKPEREAEFLDMASGLIAQVHANEPGTLLYTLTRNLEAEHTYTWVERYRDEEAIQLHRQSAYLAEARAQMLEMLSRPMSALRLQQQLPA